MAFTLLPQVGDHSAACPINQPINRSPINRSTNQPINQLTDQPIINFKVSVPAFSIHSLKIIYVKFIISFLFLVITIMICSCQPAAEKKTSKEEERDFLAGNIDSTIDPSDDFFMYANNGWFKKNPIPASEQSNGIFLLIQDTVNAQVQQLCESASKLANAAPGSNKQKIGDMYYSGMDSMNINKAGLSHVAPEIDLINKITNSKDLPSVVARLHAISGAPMFGFYVGQDDRNSEKYSINITQGGLSLPDRSYYFDKDKRAADIREKFSEHLRQAFRILGYDSAGSHLAAKRMMKLETAIATASRKREDTRDPYKNYNKMSFPELLKITPNWAWNVFMNDAGLTSVDTVIVGQPEFLTAMNSYLTTFPVEAWKDYLKIHLLRGLANYLDDRTYSEFFNFYATTLRGIQEPRPRWKRVTDQTNNSLGELIGQVYVQEFLPKGTKEKLEEIGNAIREVYAERIKKLDWMSEATKQKALYKLKTMVMKVGHPDKWKDLSSMKISRESYVKNVMNANEWEFRYSLNKFGKPVDRTEWFMYPQTYNAYYNPPNNEVVVPGCNIIVPGYERKLADDAVLYGIIGASTFGHEITHGFDDQGSQYDEKGNLNNWWTPEDSLRFRAKTKMIVAQYNNYVAVDSLRINGELTQGENIADLGGAMMGYEAFKKTKQYQNREIIGGLNPDQRYFLAFALAWMMNERPESVANQVRSDEHSPVRFRVIGPLANMPEFYSAFGIKPGSKMHRPDSLRVKIW
jgi:putative endopeptidase